MFPYPLTHPDTPAPKSRPVSTLLTTATPPPDPAHHHALVCNHPIPPPDPDTTNTPLFCPLCILQQRSRAARRAWESVKHNDDVPVPQRRKMAREFYRARCAYVFEKLRAEAQAEADGGGGGGDGIAERETRVRFSDAGDEVRVFDAVEPPRVVAEPGFVEGRRAKMLEVVMARRAAGVVGGFLRGREKGGGDEAAEGFVRALLRGVRVDGKKAASERDGDTVRSLGEVGGEEVFGEGEGEGEGEAGLDGEWVVLDEEDVPWEELEGFDVVSGGCLAISCD